MDIKILKPNETGFGYLIEHDAGFISPDEERNKLFINEIKSLDSKNLVIAEPFIVYAVLQKHGVKNRNGRIYPEHILKSQDKVYQELIKDGRALGELEHPESNIINSDRVAHNILETWWEGSTLMGKLQIILSPGFVKHGIISCKGDQVVNLLRNGIKIGVSSRGVGSIKTVNGEHVVQDDFEMICWDVVISPSTPGSWVFNNVEQAAPFIESVSNKGVRLVETLDKFINNF